jgi:hypothetical protein
MKYLLTTLALAVGLSASAQCRTFTKKSCLPLLENFVQNDNYKSAILIPGDDAEVELTFLGGYLNRVLVCSDPALDVTWSLAAERNDTTYNSVAGKPIDFVSYKTHQRTIRIKVAESSDGPYEGCVTIMVGKIKL